MKLKISFLLLVICLGSVFGYAEKRQMEALNRGLIAVKVDNGVFLSWRLLGTDSTDVYFSIQKNGELIKSTGVSEATNWVDPEGTLDDRYSISAYRGEEHEDYSQPIRPMSQQYLTVQLSRPPAGKTPPNKTNAGTSGAQDVNYPDGEDYTYTPNDCSVGDLDGDGEYEIIVKWDPSNSKDNSQAGISGNVYIDAYKLDGTQLWRIDLGKNIRAGAHYTQFLVYDFDGDGKAELVCKTAPGTIDGKGNYVIMGSDDPQANYRNEALTTGGNNRIGFILKGPEYLTLFDGVTGEELHSVAYEPARGTVSSWGDSYGNRVDRFLACVAYLDGIHPSVVMCRGYYAKAALAAYDVKDKKLVKRWNYDSSASVSVSGGSIAGQGNHNLSVADVDGDGKDEIIYGSSAISHDGKRLYSTGLGHGDAMHVSDLDPDRPGLEVWEVHEEKTSGKWNHELHDARTGEIIWHSAGYDKDNGRGLAADIDPNHRGFEMWSSSESGVYNCKGVQISTGKPSTNFRVYWDGDLQDELLDGDTPSITKWNPSTSRATALFALTGSHSVNGTKRNPCLSADILGDWREEIIAYVTNNPSQLRIYTTTIPTEHRFHTLMHDPVYRLGIAWQNVAYNQPPHLGVYIGDGVADILRPEIFTDPSEDPSLSSMGNIRKDETGVKISLKERVLVIDSEELIRSIAVYSMDGRCLSQTEVDNMSVVISGFDKQERILIVKVVTDTHSKSYKLVNY